MIMPTNTPNSHALLIREAIAEDKAQLILIEEQCFVSDKISALQMQYLLSTKSNSLCLVGTINHQLIAYALILFRKNSRFARLYSVAVMEEFQGKGIAKQLLSAAMEHLQQKQYIGCRLEVRESHHHAKNLYRQLGFKATKKLPAYYQDLESAIKMEARFKS